MTAAINPMRSIYTKLSAAGYKQPFIKSLLPDWWDDEIASSPSGVQQASLVLGKLLGVRPETLWSGDVPVDLSIPAERKFKRRSGSNLDSLDVACAIAFSAARMTLRAYKHEYRPDLVVDAAQLRSRIVKDREWVDMPELLDYCSQIGVPVIYLSHFPKGIKKMAGLAFEVAGRPVIALTQTKQYGYMLFDLAHEVGHVTLGHVAGNKCVVDQSIDQDSDDEDERSANRFALELLTGDPDCKIVPTGRSLTGSELATAALRYGQNRKVDPMHVVLNYGHTVGHWGAANIALAQLAHGRKSDQDLVCDMLMNSIDVDVISEDDIAVLQKLSGVVGL